MPNGTTEQTELDPLFYRGRTPVLGEPVEVRVTGELPATFPAISGPAPAATRPGGPGAPAPPAFPEFEGGALEFPTPPELPPGMSFGAFPGPWRGPADWSALLQIPGVARRLFEAGTETGRPTGGLGGGDFWTPGAGGRIAGEGFGVRPGTGEIESFGLQTPSAIPAGATQWTPGVGGTIAGEGVAVPAGGGFESFGVQTGAEAAEAGTAAAEAGTAAAEAGTAGAGLAAPGALQVAGAAVGTGLGAYEVARGNEARGATMMALALMGLTPLAPVAGAAGLLLALQSSGLLSGDRATWPQGYAQIPSQPNAAVDPASGAILWYKGHGQYEWSPQTQAGERATREQLMEWGIASPLYPETAPTVVSIPTLGGEWGFSEMREHTLPRWQAEPYQTSVPAEVPPDRDPLQFAG